VQRDRPELHEVEQRRQVAADEARRGDPGLRLDLRHPYTLRILGRVLLEERRPVDSFRVALEGERPVGEDWEKHRRDLRVVAHDVALRDAVTREVRLVEAGDLKRPAVLEGDGAIAAVALDRRELVDDWSKVRGPRP
jgi:hypothetical protein